MDLEEELNQNDEYDKLSVLVWFNGDSSYDDGAIGGMFIILMLYRCLSMLILL
jgi:hypothetical protein